MNKAQKRAASQILIVLIIIQATASTTNVTRANQTYTLYVRVRDEGDNPIEGASIYLDGEYQEETNVEGELNVHGVSEGIHEILVIKKGYLEEKATIKVKSNLVVPVTLKLIEMLPDLTVSSLKLSNRRPPEGKTVVILAVIANKGKGDAGGFFVSFKVDASELFSSSIEKLQAGENIALEVTWTAEGVGVHTVFTLVDPKNDVTESYERNNELTQTVEVIAYTPDLIVKELSFEPLEPRVGEEVQFSITIENTGIASTSGFHWSLGPFGWDSQMKSTGYVSEGLEVGALITVHTSFIYDNAGSYLAVAVVDPENEVEEASEENNALEETITVAKIKFNFSWGGRIVKTDIPIFGFPDEDNDTINDCWENAATIELNPYVEFDEEEDMYQYQHEHPTHTVVNFVRVTPYPNKTNPVYVILNMRLTFTRDYGRFSKTLEIESHNGDTESMAMAWQVLDDTTLKLMWVYTGAHGTHVTGHRGVWSPWREMSNTGNICVHTYIRRELIGPTCDWVDTEQFRSGLEFHNNRLSVQVSEDKHAIYPTCQVCEEVMLAKPSPFGISVIPWFAGLLLDGINFVGQVFEDVFDFLFGWINFEDDKIGADQTKLLTYDVVPSRPGLVPVQEIHFRGDGAHYILYWQMKNLGNRRVDDKMYRHVRIELVMLHCEEEMDLDGFFSFADEVYLIVTGFSLYPEIDAWSVIDDPVVDQSVDGGDDCTEIFSQPIVVFDGEISDEWLIGFNVILMEQDFSGSAERRDLVRHVLDGIREEISGAGLSHVGDCGVGAGTVVSSWAVGTGEDCAGGEFGQIPSYNVGEDLNHLMPSFERLIGEDHYLTYFGFNEPLEGVDYNGKKKFCGGLSPDENSPGSLMEGLVNIPDLLREKLDEEFG